MIEKFVQQDWYPTLCSVNGPYRRVCPPDWPLISLEEPSCSTPASTLSASTRSWRSTCPSTRCSQPKSSGTKDFVTDENSWVLQHLPAGSFSAAPSNRPTRQAAAIFSLKLFLFLSAVLTRKRSWSTSPCCRRTPASRTSSQSRWACRCTSPPRRRRNTMLRRSQRSVNFLRANRSETIE